ncbi:MAG: pectate lyase-like adhesive domain-containing protein, partial [Pseudolabrys sp.]
MALTSLLLASSALVSGPASAADITVTDAASLSAAIAGASAGDRILLQNDIALGTTLLPPVLSNITIDGNGHTIDAGGNNRIFFLDSSATIQNVTLTGGKATGGNGGAGQNGGGGGLGAGGAIFVNSGTATIANVGFSNNSATGGNAGGFPLTGSGTAGGGGGGGLGGCGGGCG